MKKKGSKVWRILLILAICSFFVALLEGIIYYSDIPNVFFRTLLILQNTINAFCFKPGIKIEEAILYMQTQNSVFCTAVSYAYGVAVFTAPYCTLAVVYKFLEKLVHFVVILKKPKINRNIIIFGYNEDVKELIKNYNPDKHVCVHIITPDKPDSSEMYSMEKRGYRFHISDISNCSDKDLKKALSKTNISNAENIILFDSSSVVNFSVLQIFALNKTDPDWKIRLKSGTRISCRCESTAIKDLITDYYDSFSGEETCYDLEIFSIPELQIHKMLSEIPLYTYYKNKDIPLCKWDTKLLLIGFGSVGQEFLLQVMNLAVMHEKNNIEVDIFDTDIDNKARIFANNFSLDAFDFDGHTIKMKSSTADGKMEFHFYNTNVLYKEFSDIIRDNIRKSPYTYVTVAIDNLNTSMDCAIKLSSILDEFKCKEVPLIIRMDSDRRLADYININDTTFSGANILDDRKSVLTLDMIVENKFYGDAKLLNHIYNNIQFIEKGTEVCEEKEKSPDDEWNLLQMFKRDSSKASAYHDKEKDTILEKLAKEYNVNLYEKIESLMGENGTLFRYNGKAWEMDGTDKDFIEKLKSDGFAYDVASLEHRRWCCFMASCGWHCDKRDNRLKRNPCIVTEEKLIEIRPDMVKYDLMSLMSRYLNYK